VAEDPKTRMIEGAARLLASKGLQATSFSEVLAATGAPRGSLYHHFPGGKDELVAAALDLVNSRALALIERRPHETPRDVVSAFLDMWRELLVRSQFRAGCAVLAVTVAADSPALLDRTGAIFRAWQDKLTSMLRASGLTSRDATYLATMLIASSEGAVGLSRALRSLEPFERVATDLLRETERRTASARREGARKRRSRSTP
jgi:AcrR family transcriptional regulator